MSEFDSVILLLRGDLEIKIEFENIQFGAFDEIIYI